MNIEEILQEIYNKGFFFAGWVSDDTHKMLHDKVIDGTLQTLPDLGIIYMNGDYFYLLPGNPRKVTIVNNGRDVRALRLSL